MSDFNLDERIDSAAIYAAKHVGDFDEKTQKQLRKGEIHTIYLYLPAQREAIKQIIRDVIAEITPDRQWVPDKEPFRSSILADEKRAMNTVLDELQANTKRLGL